VLSVDGWQSGNYFEIDINVFGSMNSFKEDGTACITQTFYSTEIDNNGNVYFQPTQSKDYWSQCEGGEDGFNVAFEGSMTDSGFVLQDSQGCYSITLSIYDL